MKTKITLVIITLFFSQMIYAGDNDKLRLIYNSNELNKPVTDDTLQIKYIRIAFFSEGLIVKLQNNKKLFFKPRTIWGFQDEKGNYYRYSNDMLYKVEQLDTLVIYSKQNGFETLDKDYYFSKTNDSKIFNITRKDLKNEFSSNICFLEKLDANLKWYNGYLSIDRESVGYIIMSFYKQCKT